MSYDVFISWSGENSVSHNFAKSLKKWLSIMIQASKCYVSSEDIDAGEVWLSNLLKNLSDAKCGILCLTPDTLDKPWIFFEAGALAVKFDKSNVIPLLIGVEKSDMKFPLAALQCKLANREGIWDIVKCVNKSLDKHTVSEPILEETFKIFWASAEEEFLALTKSTNLKPNLKKRTPEDKIDEILGLVRSLQKNNTNDINNTTTDNFINLQSQDCDLYNRLVSRVSQKRPLAISWLTENVIARSTKGGVLNLYYPKEEMHSYESLNRENQLNFLNAIIKEVGGLKVNLFMLPG